MRTEQKYHSIVASRRINERETVNQQKKKKQCEKRLVPLNFRRVPFFFILHLTRLVMHDKFFSRGRLNKRDVWLAITRNVRNKKSCLILTPLIRAAEVWRDLSRPSRLEIIWPSRECYIRLNGAAFRTQSRILHPELFLNKSKKYRPIKKKNNNKN